MPHPPRQLVSIVCAIAAIAALIVLFSTPKSAGTGNVPGNPSPLASEVVFEDPALERAIRKAINQPTGPLDGSRLATIQALNLSWITLTSLQGLELLTGLKDLNLSGVSPRSWDRYASWPPEPGIDLSPLSGLTKLEKLNLSLNRLTDYNALAPLINIRELSVGEIQNLQPLAGMTHLQRLSIYTDPAEDLHWEVLGNFKELGQLDAPGSNAIFAALANCPRLTTYNISRLSDLQDITAIGGLKALTNLSLRMTDVQDIRGVEGCTNLDVLTLGSNPIRDLRPLAMLTRLRELDLSITAVRDLTPLTSCVALEVLYLNPSHDDLAEDSWAPILADLSPLVALPVLRKLTVPKLVDPHDLEPLRNCKALRDLSVNAEEVLDLAPIGSIARLESLSIDMWKPLDLACVTRLKSLRRLALHLGDERPSFAPIAACTNLEELELDTNFQAFELAALAAHPGLSDIELQWGAQVGDLTPLASLPALRTLRVRTSMDNYHGLEGCTRLETLFAPASPKLMTLLTSFPDLRHLEMSGGELDDTSALASLSKLESFDLWSTKIRDLSPLAGLPAFKLLKLGHSSVPAEVESAQFAALRNRGVTIESTQLTIYIPLAAPPVIATAESTPKPLVPLMRESELLPVAPAGIPTTPVHIPDKALRENFRYLFGRKEGEAITRADMARCTVLNFEMRREIADLTGMETCINLEYLDLNFNDNLASIAPLAGLQHLKVLDVSGTLVNDITPLLQCPALEDLTLRVMDHAKPMPDLAILAQFPNLRTLDLSWTGITDLRPIAACVNLESLDVSENDGITDFTPLAALTKLRVLNLLRMEIADISFMQGMTEMEELWLGWGSAIKLSDISPLAGMTRLRKLHIWGSEITSVAALANMPLLEDVNLTEGKLTSLTGLENPRLKVLRLRDNQVASLVPLAGNTALEILDAEANPNITSADGLQQLVRLRELNLAGSRITDFAPLRSLVHLQRLELTGNPAPDISPLAGMAQLKSLTLGPSPLVDLTPLASLTALENLRVSGTQVHDLTPLKGLTHLKSADLGGNQITDLQPLVDGPIFHSGGSLEVEGNPLGEQTAAQLDALRKRGVSINERYRH